MLEESEDPEEVFGRGLDQFKYLAESVRHGQGIGRRGLCCTWRTAPAGRRLRGGSPRSCGLYRGLTATQPNRVNLSAARARCRGSLSSVVRRSRPPPPLWPQLASPAPPACWRSNSLVAPRCPARNLFSRGRDRYSTMRRFARAPEPPGISPPLGAKFTESSLGRAQPPAANLISPTADTAGAHRGWGVGVGEP
ncbi:hypothetical protein SKAU_G00023760 [Synaphobranchus kaupii]|uniref:Uncharacterized protein n=1 Tax=Synaphobranchus kaupii TaxID=118154 RepID=A0A9Q1JDD7_SYNKA|nr:hypothetical protein SKAU_G00023760 [Synaphobranchus kaupii]